MIYLVTFTLNPKRDASLLFRELQESASWLHYIDDTWLVASNESVWDLWARVAKYTLRTDRVLVTEILKQPDAQVWGWLPPDAWTWIAYHRGLTTAPQPPPQAAAQQPSLPGVDLSDWYKGIQNAD